MRRRMAIGRSAGVSEIPTALTPATSAPGPGSILPTSAPGLWCRRPCPSASPSSCSPPGSTARSATHAAWSPAGVLRSMLPRVVLRAHHPHPRRHLMHSLRCDRPTRAKSATAHEHQTAAPSQVESAVDVLYILDVVANSRTAYVEGGVVVLDSGRILLRYRRRREPRAPRLLGSAARPAEMRRDGCGWFTPFLFAPSPIAARRCARAVVRAVQRWKD